MKFDELGLGDIMMVPDCVFGRRWWVTTTVTSLQGTGFGLSLLSFPEVGVIWELSVTAYHGSGAYGAVEMRYADRLAGTYAIFNTGDPVLPEFVGEGRLPSSVTMWAPEGLQRWPMRRPFRSASRQLSVAVTVANPGAGKWMVGMLVSGMPVGEVPKWLC